MKNKIIYFGICIFCLAAVLLCTIIVPTVVGSLKKVTNVYCPNQLAIYEAFSPYAKVFEKYPDNSSLSIKAVVFREDM